MGTTVDPLKDFFDSLDLMKTFDDVRMVLPAHGLEFADLSGRAEAIKRHHHERLDKLRTASGELGRGTVRGRGASRACIRAVRRTTHRRSKPASRI